MVLSMTETSVPEEPETRYVNLLTVFDRLNERYFDGKCCAGIGWRNIRIGKSPPTLGICETTERIIRINTILSDVRVPYYVLESVVYHEMLHVMLGPEHDDEFLAIDSKFPGYEESERFLSGEFLNIVSEWRAWRDYKNSLRKS